MLISQPLALVTAERNYEGKQWVAYDRQYHREALSRKDLNWSVPGPRLYNEAFTGRAWVMHTAPTACRTITPHTHALAT